MEQKTLLTILENTSLGLAGLEFSPVLDSEDEITGAQLIITADLLDKDTEEPSTVDIIEKHFLGEDTSLEKVMLDAEQAEENSENEHEEKED